MGMKRYKKGSNRSFLFRLIFGCLVRRFSSMLTCCFSLSYSSLIWSKLNLNISAMKLPKRGSSLYKDFYDRKPHTERFAFN